MRMIRAEVAPDSHRGGTTMLERALPVPQIVLDKDLRTRERTYAREFIQVLWDRAKQLLRALVDFFAAGGPLS